MRIFLLLLLLASAIALARSARAEQVQLVSSGDLIALVDGPQVRVFLGDGRFLLRLPAGGIEEAAAAGPPELARERREQILDLHDVPMDLRDTQGAEDLIEDELTLAQRRDSAPAVAAPGRDTGAGGRRRGRPLAGGGR